MPNMASTPTPPSKSSRRSRCPSTAGRSTISPALRTSTASSPAASPPPATPAGKPKSVPEYFEHLDPGPQARPRQEEGRRPRRLPGQRRRRQRRPRRRSSPSTSPTGWSSPRRWAWASTSTPPISPITRRAEDGFTLSSNDEEIRRFWVEHGKRCRKIGEYFGP